MNTTEGNKALAVFQGVFMNEHGQIISGTRYVGSDELKYHTSLDWLKPVVEKWFELRIEYIGVLRFKYLKLDEDLKTALQTFNPETIFNQLVICITWYNKNKEA